MIYVVKLTFFRHFLQTSKSDSSPFLVQLRQKRDIYLKKKKPYYPLFESRFETGRIFIMTGSTRVLVKVVLFHLRGRGHPQDRAMPNSFLILKALSQGFQMRYHLFLNSFRKVVKIAKVFSTKLAVPIYISTSLWLLLVQVMNRYKYVCVCIVITFTFLLMK